nr:HlyD family efflux transporter periplasmic adaptor subunit [Kofleriaceae bacterium]
MATLLALLTSCAADDPAPVFAPPAVAAPRPAPVVAPLVGVLAAQTSDVVAAQIDGRIASVIATTGQHVRAGDPIAELDATTIDDRARAATAAVEAARAESAGAGAEVVEAERQLALEQRLYAAGAAAAEQVRLSRASLVHAEANAARAAASMREADAQRAAVDDQRAHMHVVAPIDGVVSLVKAQPGEVVGAGAVIARVFDPGALAVRFQVTRERRRDIAVGTEVELQLAGGDGPVRARVTSLSADLEPPLDFAVAEAAVVGATPDAPIGSVGDVRVVAGR